jgi:hypothetical protein
MVTYGGVDVTAPSFLTSALDIGVWSASRRKHSNILGPENGACVSKYSRDSAVGIATGYGAGRLRGPSSNPVNVKNFLFTSSRAYLGPTQTPYLMGTGGFFPPGKAVGA